MSAGLNYSIVDGCGDGLVNVGCIEFAEHLPSIVSDCVGGFAHQFADCLYGESLHAQSQHGGLFIGWIQTDIVDRLPLVNASVEVE